MLAALFFYISLVKILRFAWQTTTKSVSISPTLFVLCNCFILLNFNDFKGIDKRFGVCDVCKVIVAVRLHNQLAAGGVEALQSKAVIGVGFHFACLAVDNILRIIICIYNIIAIYAYNQIRLFL